MRWGVAGTRLAGGHEDIPKLMVFPRSGLQNRHCMCLVATYPASQGGICCARAHRRPFLQPGAREIPGQARNEGKASPNRRSSTVPFLHDVPIDNPPEGLEVGGAAVLVVEVVGVFPDVEGQEGLEPMGGGVVGAGVLADGQGAIGIGLEPDPAGAEEGGAGGDEGGLEGGEGAPLGLDPSLEGPGRPFDRLRDRPKLVIPRTAILLVISTERSERRNLP